MTPPSKKLPPAKARWSFHRDRPGALQRRYSASEPGFGECDHCGGSGLEDKRYQIVCEKCFGIGAIRDEDRDPLCKHKAPPRLCCTCSPDNARFTSS